MPNWVYSGINVSSPLTKKQEEIIEKIKKVGSICQYYKPRPEEYNFVSGHANIDGKKCKYWRREEIDGVMTDIPIEESEIDKLVEKYGFRDWYDWSLHNWNTKWGDCSLEIDHCSISCELRFETAWSPICDSILEIFAKDFPDFHFWYEEECEWGGEKNYEEGKCVHESSYDEPQWREEEEIEIKGLSVFASYLEEKHPLYDDGVGYYEEYCRDQYLGKNIEEAVDTLEKFVKEANERQKNKSLTL
jgi:hypothetical protein